MEGGGGLRGQKGIFGGPEGTLRGFWGSPRANGGVPAQVRFETSVLKKHRRRGGGLSCTGFSDLNDSMNHGP